jgi:hypothetical protein
LRVSQGDTQFRVRAIAGTHVVLMAMDMDADTRQGLRGFAIKRGVSGQPQTFLRGIKFFEDLVPDHDPKQDFSSRDQPFQTFLWSDYHASPGTSYDFTIIALYGDIHAFEERHTLTFSIKTEPEFDQGHGVFFNRGTIASHAFETTFNNKPLTDEMTENVSDDGKLLDPETAWLSRGLAEACLKYINDTKRGEGLRVCAYEFTYLPVLRALKRAIDRGVDVQIVYHDTKKDDDPNRAAIAKARLPKSATHVRTRTKIPHNKFIVKLAGGAPVQVWTRRHGKPRDDDDPVQRRDDHSSCTRTEAGCDAFCHPGGHPYPRGQRCRKAQPRQARLLQRRDPRKVVHQVQEGGRRRQSRADSEFRPRPMVR